MKKKNKVGRPKKKKKDKKQIVSFSIPYEQWKFLQEIEDKSKLIEKLITEAMEEMKKAS